jgi:hypothetical protein
METLPWVLASISSLDYSKVDIVFRRQIIVEEKNEGQCPCCLSDTLHRFQPQEINITIEAKELADILIKYLSEKYAREPS